MPFKFVMFYGVNMKLTFQIIILNLIVFAFQLAIPGFSVFFGLVPSMAITGNVWQFFTYMFLHSPSSILHIAFNMFVLLIFGTPVEETLGKRKFLTIYIISGLGSAFFYLGLTGITNSVLIGASGAVFGILTAYAFLFPRNWIFIPPGIPVRGLYAVIVLAVIEAISGIFSLQSGIANFGHLGGIIVGLMAMLYLRHADRKQQASREFEFFWE